jgi:hypothetical protein
MTRRTAAGLAALALSFLLSTGPAFAAKKECPRYSVLLEGTTVVMGVSYTERAAAHKLGSGDGYDGLWKVDTFEQTIKYPYPLGITINRTDRLEVAPGKFMNVRATGSGNTIRTFSEMVNINLEVVGAKVRAEGAPASWNGSVSGNQMAWKFHPENPNEPVIRGTIQEGPKDPIELTLVEPAADGKYAFDESSPGKLVLKLKAKASPSAQESNIQWDIPEIDGAKRTVAPADGKGPSVEVTYEGLPDSYKSFGKKSVKATLTAGSCVLSEDRDIRIFYSRDARNNPRGQDYNWFYYWKQTPAAKPRGQLVNIEFGGTKFDSCSLSGVPGIFKPAAFYKTIHICDLTTKLDKDFTLVYPKVKRGVAASLTALSTAKATHIDTFALILLHEYQHFLAFHNWREGKSDAQIDAEDGDNDGIPDATEIEMGFNPKKFQTFLGATAQGQKIGGDEEFLAYEAMYDYKVGTYDAYDWGKPGKNWK